MKKTLYHRMMNAFIAWITKEPPPDENPPCDFNRIKYELRQGDVLLIEGHSRVSQMIRTVTQSPWTHAALYIGSLHDIEDHELRKTVALHLKKRENVRLVIESELGRGVVVVPLSNFRHHHIRICRPIGITPSDVNLALAYAIKHLGQPYSMRRFFDLARFLLPWSILPRRWGSSLFRTSTGEIESGICSTLIAEAFTSVKFPILPVIVKDKKEESNFEVVNRNPHLFAPKDFDYSPYFEIIKYPIFDPHEPLPYYRRLPWAEGVLHQDRGILSHANQKPEKKKFFSILPLGSKTEKKLPSDHDDDNIDKPETD